MGKSRQRKLQRRAEAAARLELADLGFGAQWEQVCRQADGVLPPAQVYAMRKTGTMITSSKAGNFTPEQIAAWKDAVDEFGAAAGVIGRVKELRRVDEAEIRGPFKPGS